MFSLMIRCVVLRMSQAQIKEETIVFKGVGRILGEGWDTQSTSANDCSHSHQFPQILVSGRHSSDPFVFVKVISQNKTKNEIASMPSKIQSDQIHSHRWSLDPKSQYDNSLVKPRRAITQEQVVTWAQEIKCQRIGQNAGSTRHKSYKRHSSLGELHVRRPISPVDRLDTDPLEILLFPLTLLIAQQQHK